MVDQARQLFDDYDYYRQHTLHFQKRKKENPYIQRFKATPERLQLMENMAAWCKEREFDPRLWLYGLFVNRYWKFSPKLEASHLLSEKQIPKFKKLRNRKFFRKYLEAQKALDIPLNVFDPNRDMSSSSEQAKRDYLQQRNTAECMARMFDETFGYHPKSKVCVYCPAQKECIARLQASVEFDIMSLRLGKITAEDARTQILIRMQGYGR